MKRVREIIRFQDHPDRSRYRGQGVSVAVLDSGISLHPDFGNRILSFQDLLNKKTAPYDDCGHGTHVSGIIGGNGVLSNGTYAGIAPACSLIMLKILDQRGDGAVKDLLSGIEWVHKYRNIYEIRIVNISVGTLPGTETSQQKAVLDAVDQLWDDGIVVVTAAGNYGPQKGSITIPGISRKVITVGSSEDKYYRDASGRHRKNYSGRGPTPECVCKPDLVAPGSYLTSCNASYSGQKSSSQKNTPYTVKSGTSMSTPVVSGAVAVLLSKFPEMTNVEVKLKLRESCTDLKLPRNRQGWGLLNMEKLLRC